MTSVTNSRILFNKIPADYPVPGETTVLDNNEQIDLNAPLYGGVLIKVLVLSIDPYMRDRMRDPAIKSYALPYLKGKPLDNFGVGVVLRSEDPTLKAGDHVYGNFEFQEYVITYEISQFKVLENKENLPWSAYVGVAGMPGQTAYIGWKLYAKAKKGETVFVTTAAGPVGSAVVQIAKSEGLKVIASAGSDEKAAFVKELGADVVFNYKKKDTKDALKELGHGIDIYWDNVGGEMLEDAIDAANSHARFINCGLIRGLKEADAYGVKNLHQVVLKSLTLQGFVALELLEDWKPEFYDVFPRKIASGEIKHREHVYSLQQTDQALLDLQKGNNRAKAVIILADA